VRGPAATLTELCCVTTPDAIVMGQAFLNDDSGSRPNRVGVHAIGRIDKERTPGAPWMTKVRDNCAQRTCPMADALARCIL
jgi:hypothetical protein